jgi:hypothetical protein
LLTAQGDDPAWVEFGEAQLAQGGPVWSEFGEYYTRIDWTKFVLRDGSVEEAN